MSLQAAVDRLGVAVSNVCLVKANHAIEDIHGPAGHSCDQPRSENSGNAVFPELSILCFLDQIVNGELREILNIAQDQNDLNPKNVLTPGKMVPNPTAPKNLLSINHLRIVYTVIELLWVCGVLPTVRTTLGDSFDWGEGAHPKSLLLPSDVLILLSKKDAVMADSSLAMQYVQCIHSLISVPLFSTNMLPRNLRRVLVALLVLTGSESSTGRTISGLTYEECCRVDIVETDNGNKLISRNDVRTSAKQLLDGICFHGDSKTFVVSELRIATRGPPWMRSAASDLFSRMLLSERGLEAVLRAYLEGVTDAADSTPIQIRVAKLVTSVPTWITKQEYLERLSVQIVDLLQFGVDIKDIILQKVCVMVITRVSHLNPIICDEHLLMPLASALLSVDIKRKKPSNRSFCENNESDRRNDSEYIALISNTEQVEAAVFALHALVTLCPLQPPLVASIQRSGVGKAALILCLYLQTEMSRSPLLPIVKEFCFIFLSNSSDITALAVQLHDMVVNSTYNEYVIGDGDKLCVKERCVDSGIRSKVRDVNERQSDRTAATLAHRLGISGDSDSDVNVISSPELLLSAMRHDDKGSTGQKYTNTSDISDERKAGDDIGHEVDAILSMAATAANKYEKQNVPYNSSVTPFGASSSSSSSRSRKECSLWDVTSVSAHAGEEPMSDNVSRDYNDIDSGNIDSTNVSGAGLGHEMMEVSLRARVAIEFLLSFESHVVSTGKIKQNSAPSTTGRDKREREKDSEGSESSEDGESVVSELFIYCLQRFLGMSTAPVVGNNELIEMKHVSTSFHSPNSLHSEALSTIGQSLSNVPGGMSGLLLVMLQSHVPADMLLKGGLKVIEVIDTILKAHAICLEQSVTSFLNKGDPMGAESSSAPSYSDVSSSSSSSRGRTGPLIQEIAEITNHPQGADHESDSVNQVTEGVGEDGDRGESEMVPTVLGILSAMLALGASRRNIREETALKGLLRPLQVIAFREGDVELAQAASDASLLLLTRNCATTTPTAEEPSNIPHNPTSRASGGLESSSPFSLALFSALRDFCSSPEPHMRAIGVHYITVASSEATQPMTVVDVQLGVSALVALLSDLDSYVYMSVLTAISRLADINRHCVFQALIEAFAQESRVLGPSGGPSEGLSTRNRALVGEALSAVLRRAGEAAPPLVPALITACIRVVRVRPTREEESSVEGLVNLRTMTINKKEELNSEGGEVRSASEERREAKREAEYEQNLSLAASTSDSALLRQSAMSLLAEGVVCAGWLASKYLTDILDIAIGVLAMEGLQASQTSSTIKRSAAFLLRHILLGLREKLIFMKDGGIYLKATYRALKLSCRSADLVVKFHSEAGMGALDEMMREQLFLSESQLKGGNLPKIRIL